MVILVSIVAVLVAAIVFLYGFYKVKNRPMKPDYFEYYKTQDKTPVGKVGVFSTSLILPEDHSHVFWHNIPYKVFNQVIIASKTSKNGKRSTRAKRSKLS